MDRENDATEIVRAHAGALLARAYRLTGTRDDAWDLVQDTFMRALTRRPPNLPEVRLRRWLMVILGNLHRDRCRAEGRRRRIDLNQQVACFMPAEEATPEPAWSGLDMADVHACLARLDPRFREAYVLHEEHGMPLAAIAARLGVPLATAGTRVHRARRNLRRLLTPNLGLI